MAGLSYIVCGVLGILAGMLVIAIALITYDDVWKT